MDGTSHRGDLSLVKRALLELREMRARVDEAERARTEPIAIVGMACRFPGSVSTPEAFWELLRDGRDAITEIPADRWNLADYFDRDPDAPGKMYTRHGGFLDAIDRFDARFFGVTPREAERLDPQQRLLLEVAWEALERAGVAPDRLMGDPTGVFVGLSAGDYMQLQLKLGDLAAIDAYMASGSSPAVASGRVSYTLGLRGPSMTVDTACSSSLAAVHLACQSLRNGECRTALAGGVSIILMPELNINFSKARMMAPDGRCKTFDAAADGYVRSEGCGLVVLRRLSDAQAAGDPVLAIIRGSALNQDGRSSGLTVPNGPAQEAVIREALARSGVQPSEVDYVEAHGTGTSLGDPIEVRALGAVFRGDRPAGEPLLLGSVKTNVGHLEAAAGIAGLIKVVLSMQHGEIPAHLHLRELNPHVDWSALPIQVPSSRVEWRARSGRRIAGISSFGFSGTNAHVVVESAPQEAERSVTDDRPLHVLPLSAKSEPALRMLAARVAQHLEAVPSASLADAAFTLGAGRAHFAHRLAVVTDGAGGARTALAAFASRDAGAAITGIHAAPTAPQIAFLFTGQGSQYVGMGRTLYQTEPAFRRVLEQCDELLRAHLDRSILDVIFDRHGAGALLDQTAYTQPALFALEYALVELWKSWGVEPSIVMGHSLGEDVAACVAGIFGLEDGLKLIAARGRLMQDLPKLGEMHAVFASEAQVRAAIGDRARDVSIAAMNAPEHITISGRTDAMREVLADLGRQRVKTKAIAASHAFHSPLMDPMLDAFERYAADITYREPRVTFVSTLSGSVAGLDQVGHARYWRRHVREPVRFAESVQAIWAQGCRLFVEIGPSPVLVGLGPRCAPDDAGVWLPTLRRGRDDWREILTSLATLYAHGTPVDWEGFGGGRVRRRVALPTYPFERERHWVPLRDAAPAASPARRTVSHSPSLTVSTWPRVIDAARRRSLEGPLDLALPTYAAKWERLNQLGLEYITAALRHLGVFGRSGERYRADALRARCGIVDTYRGLVPRWLRTLAAAGRLRVDADGEAFVADAPLPVTDPDALVVASRELFNDYPSVLEYMHRCGARLADVVTGRESPLETLFPGGSSSIADELYGRSPLARYFNGIVCGAVETAASSAAPERPLRLLEIGAGTGGTTAGLLAALAPDRVEYCFTDVGQLFLSRGRERFAGHPFVSFQLLDIEKHPREQGFAAHEFDVIVAANVLHATRNLHETLDHVAWLLAGSGVLVMYEATAHPEWFDVTTGLISGWQRFQDDLRTDVPLIPPGTWERALLSHGFEEMRAFPEVGTPAEVLAQHVLIARGAVAVDHAGDSNTNVHQASLERAPHLAAPEVTANFRSRLEALPSLDRREALVSFVRDCIVRVLRLDPSRPAGRDQRLMDLGVDSLMAVELRNVLSMGLATDKKLPATLIFDYPTIDAIADYLLRSVLGFDVEPSAIEAVDAASGEVDRVAGEIEDLEDEEVEALLNKRLEGL